MKKFNANLILPKKAYQQPRLKNFGDLRKITQAGAASKGESFASADAFFRRKL